MFFVGDEVGERVGDKDNKSFVIDDDDDDDSILVLREIPSDSIEGLRVILCLCCMEVFSSMQD